MCLKTSQFKQGFKKPVPPTLSNHRDRCFKAHVINRIHLCDGGGIRRNASAGICREAPHIQLYWVDSEAGNSVSSVSGLRYPSNYHGIRATHRKAQARQFSSATDLSIDRQHSIENTIELVNPTNTFGIHQLKPISYRNNTDTRRCRLWIACVPFCRGTHRLLLLLTF